MKIALLTDGIYPYVMGGMQKHSYYLVKYFAQNKVNVDVYHYIPSGKLRLPNPFSKEELQYIELIPIDYPKPKKFPGHYLYERFQYSKAITAALIKKEIPDFIYIQGFSGWHLLKNRKQLKIEQSIGVNFHGYEMFQRWPDFKTGIKLQLLKRPVLINIKRADYIFSLGGKLTDIIKSKGYGDKVIETPNGISKDWIVNLKKSEIKKIKFCFVGRAERRKGIEELNRVLLSISPDVKFEFHFIGPIEENKKVNDPRLVYHGPIYEQDEIKKILQSSDVLVCPSYSEGMPNVILEGMASGCAIIATDVGAVSGMVDETNGILIKGDIVSGLNRSLQFFINLENSKLDKMKQNSIEKVEKNFIWDRVIQDTICKIKECI